MLFLLLISFPVLASDPFVVATDNLAKPLSLDSFLETIEDQNHKYSLEDIQSGRYDHLWERHTKSRFIGRNYKSKYWFRLKFRWDGERTDKGILYLNTQPALLQQVGVLINPEGGDQGSQIVVGQLESFSARPVISSFYAFPQALEPGRAYSVLGWAHNSFGPVPIQLPFVLLSEAAFADSNQINIGIRIAFYSLTFALFVYNFCLFATLRQPVYGIYLLFLASVVLSSSGIDGSAARYLWPNEPLVLHRFGALSGVTSGLAYLGFIVLALDGVKRWKVYYQVIQAVVAIGFIACIHNVVTSDLFAAMAVAQVYAGVSLTLTFIIALRAMIKRVSTAEYVLLAVIVTLIGNAGFLFLMSGMIPITNVSLWGVHLGTACEALLLSLALAARTRMAQQASIDNLQKYEKLYKESLEGIFQFDFESSSFKCNDALARLFGRKDSSDIPTNTSVLSSFSPEVQEELPSLLMGEKVVKAYEAKIVNGKTGSADWISINMRLVDNDKGEPVSVEGTMIDISERKLREKAEKDRQQALMLYEEIYEKSIQGFFQYYLLDDRLECNNALAKILGAKMSEKECALDKHYTGNMLKAMSNDELIDILLTSGTISDFEISLVQEGSGQPVSISLTAQVVNDDEGNPIRVDGSVIDITERKKKETAEQSREVSEAKNKAKSQFFACMSHELRTPLTAILGYSEAGKETDLAEAERIHYFDTINRGGKHLLQLINDILDLSKLEAQKIDVELIPIELLPLLGEVNDTFELLAQQKELNFCIRHQFPLPEIFTSDPTRLKQVLINLCGNAIKFTDTGSISIDVSCDKESERLFFAIKDTGVGLKPDQVESLFEAFTQAEASTTRNFGGTGLGLHLSKQLAQKLGGDIEVDSRYGEGSTFTVSIETGSLGNVRWLNSVPGQERSMPHVKLRGNVLYAEDNRDNQQLIKSIIERMGADVTVVGDGQEALNRCETNVYDLIIADIRMPRIDGFELAQTLLEKNPDQCIIAVTAMLNDNDIDRYKEVGFKDILRKPIDRSEIVTALETYLNTANRAQPESNNEETCRVLLAEDNIDNQALVNMHLQKFGCITTCVVDGVEAIAQAMSGEFDLVLMDMQMPVMDGMIAVKALREKGYDKAIYALTANETPEAVQECIDAGCDGHLSKPLNKEKLFSVIQSLRVLTDKFDPVISPVPPSDNSDDYMH